MKDQSCFFPFFYVDKAHVHVHIKTPEIQYLTSKVQSTDNILAPIHQICHVCVFVILKIAVFSFYC